MRHGNHMISDRSRVGGAPVNLRGTAANSGSSTRTPLVGESGRAGAGQISGFVRAWPFGPIHGEVSVGLPMSSEDYNRAATISR